MSLNCASPSSIHKFLQASGQGSKGKGIAVGRKNVRTADLSGDRFPVAYIRYITAVWAYPITLEPWEPTLF